MLKAYIVFNLNLCARGEFVQQADHLWGLDALRGIASIAVLILHIYVYFALKIPGLPSIVSHAHLAVDAFFVMSGFVIAHSFDLRLQRGMSVSRFLWLRALRLYPLIAVGAVVGGACLLAFAFTRKDVPLSAVCTCHLFRRLFYCQQASSGMLSLTPFRLTAYSGRSRSKSSSTSCTPSRSPS